MLNISLRLTYRVIVALYFSIHHDIRTNNVFLIS